MAAIWLLLNSLPSIDDSCTFGYNTHRYQYNPHFAKALGIIFLNKESMNLVLRSNKLHYQDVCEALSSTQLNLLYTILKEKDIVEIHGKSIIFNGPVFEYWLRQT